MTKLEALAVDWNPLSGAWKGMFDKLVEFKKEFSHCNPTGGTCNDGRLVNWVYTQRQRRQQGKLEAGRVRRLSQIGFDWKSAAKPKATYSTRS